MILLCQVTTRSRYLSLETLTSGQDTDVIQTSLEVASLNMKVNSILLHKMYAVDKTWRHMSMKDESDEKVIIMISQDVPQALIPLKVRCGGNDEPYAVKIVLGWTINGPLGAGYTAEEAVSNFIHTSDVQLDKGVELFWKIDVGHVIDQPPQLYVADKMMPNVWEQSLISKKGHIQCDISFKTNPPGLPDNNHVVGARIQIVGRCLIKDHELHETFIEAVC